MCTAIGLTNGDFYFGRNLDLECSFGENIVITPRNYRFSFKTGEVLEEHEAIIGMATVIDDYPLYAEGCNESGLCISSLNFPQNAFYHDKKEGKLNIGSFELIPYILTKYENVKDLKEDIEGFNIIDEPFKKEIGTAPLHWIVSDREGSLVIESVEDGLKVYDNPIGVLTNNPPFHFYEEYIKHFMKVNPHNPKNEFSDNLSIKPYGQGFGMIGIPGDTSPASRFIKAAFLKENSVSGEGEESNVTQFFHILENVSMVRGSTITDEGKYDITTYSCCINADKGIYYYKTYDNYRINAISMKKENLEEDKLIRFKLNDTADFLYGN
ncbi:MAG: choloylglycine hydrolase [Tissierellia bacterium]|nr:choloylglycine hydrolase [Tissierellia bacterium]